MQDQSFIPGLLIQILRGEDDVKLKAAERLWDIAAHQGNVGPSSVPTSEFLIEILEVLPASVQVETLDTLYQFSNWFGYAPWGAELLRLFRDALPLFNRLTASPDEDVCDFSEMIIENIERTAEPVAPPNGGPTERFGNSEPGGGPPSVS
jgi:hypothetical protein